MSPLSHLGISQLVDNMVKYINSFHNYKVLTHIIRYPHIYMSLHSGRLTYMYVTLIMVFDSNRDKGKKRRFCNTVLARKYQEELEVS